MTSLFKRNRICAVQSFTTLLALITVMVSLSACATRPLKLGRKGLLESDGDRSSRSIASGGQKEADEMYAPKEGEKITLTGSWQWPLNHVQVSSPFGERGNKFHQGIDLRAPIGTAVHAAADGEVVYVGSKIRGYGRMVVLKHAGNFYTVYAHHSRNAVKLGKKVKRGAVIAYSGKTGHSTGPHLHFEIRRGTQSFDPEYAINDFIGRSSMRAVASDSRPSSRKAQ
jgi:murein DD-endopeptidase MepM/ murein hydrolase activator NlpD